jgi:hypothetical protein
MGICTPILPVEETRTALGLIPSCFAVNSAMLRAFFSPFFPVQAFALPLLMIMAEMCEFFLSVSRPSTTGAAAKRQVVNAAAVFAGDSEKRRAMSVFPLFLSPAQIPEDMNPSGEVIPPFFMTENFFSSIIS